ncbi:MAG: hypothetical protein EOP39_02925 [Rubrivivax sp.]|nr:MAG: hypothetical protein EOP39_02925 [Rubrivivax sp.]
MIRMFLLAAGAAFLGNQLMKASRQRALPVADGPISSTCANDPLAGDLSRSGPDLEPGMPTDMHADADYARGA